MASADDRSNRTSFSIMTFPCDQCPKSFTTSSNLNRHRRCAHVPASGPDGAPAEGTKNCYFCFRRFADIRTFMAHVDACAGESDTPPSAEVIMWSVSDLLEWMGPLTDHQKTPVRRNIAFLFTEAVPVREFLSQRMRIPCHGLPLLVQAEVLPMLVQHLDSNQETPARMYTLMNLIKKVAEYLCSRQSRETGQYFTPSVLRTWGFISHSIDRYKRIRTLRQRDKMVFYDPKVIMSAAEIEVLTTGCQTALNRLEPLITQPFAQEEYAKYLITLSFVLLLAPRQEIMRALSLPDTLIPPENPDSECFLVSIPGLQTKTKKPVILRMTVELSNRYRFYIQNVLGSDYRGVVFRQRADEPRKDFSVATKYVTKAIIGREFGTRKFRHSIATMFSAKEGVTEEVMVRLAAVMNHSREVAVRHYVYQDRLGAQQRILEAMTEEDDE